MNSLPNRRVEKIQGMCGQEQFGSKHHRIQQLTSSQLKNKHMSNMTMAVDLKTQMDLQSFQALKKCKKIHILI